MPSYYEGLPTALLEALSYGLSVLVSDIPQHREIPLPEFRYFKVSDTDDLAKKLVELFKMGIREEKKIKYRKILEENYNWDKIAERTYKCQRGCGRDT